MQSDTDGIHEKCFPKKRKRAESNGAGFHVLETAVADDAIELTRIVPLRLKP